MDRNGFEKEKTGLSEVPHSTKILLTGFLVLIILGCGLSKGGGFFLLLLRMNPFRINRARVAVTTAISLGI